MIDAKIDIREALKKDGITPYKMLDLYIKNPNTGEFLMIHSVFMNPTLMVLLEILQKNTKTT